MRKIYLSRCLFGLAMLGWGTLGCHQEPILPGTGIPKTCQIFNIANANEAVHDTTFYQYDAFGALTESVYRQWTNARLTSSSRQQFVYSADHYLTTQTDQTSTYLSGGGQIQDTKRYSYSYKDGQLQQVTIANLQSGQTLGFRTYTYESSKLKTYTETNAQNVPLRNYIYDGSGKLTQFTELGSAIVLTNGKITQKMLQDSTVIRAQFDSQGQLLSETTTTASGQTERTYTYDNRPYWTKTQLQMRGIPSPDLGGHTNLHNVVTSGLRQIQRGRTLREQTFTYQYTFNQANYSLGYSRSDGFRQRIVYANCL